jgi:hypothetical protein
LTHSDSLGFRLVFVHKRSFKKKIKTQATVGHRDENDELVKKKLKTKIARIKRAKTEDDSKEPRSLCADEGRSREWSLTRHDALGR